MLESGCQDWIAGAQEGFDVLAEQCDKIVIVGLSMGAIAAIIIASRNQKVAGLGLLSPTIKNNGSETSKVSRLSPLIDAFPFLDKWRARASSPQQFDQMVKYCRTAAPNVKCPALVLHSREDSLTAEANALEAYRMLGSREKRMVMLSGCNPALTSDLRKEDVANLIVKLAIDASYYDPEGALLKSEVLGLV
jgi:carboxylesterase